MKLKQTLFAAAVAGASLSAQAGVYLSEGFNNVAGLSGAGWAQVSNTSGLGSGWFQGNTAVFNAADGAANSYAADNFVATASSIDEWLMTPTLTLGGDTRLSFMLRLLGDGLLDTVEVWASNAGSSTNTADFTQVASFSSDADTGWQQQNLTLAAMTGRVAFRYVVANTALAGNYVGLDSVTLVPEPSPLALVGIALAGAALVRRRRA